MISLLGRILTLGFFHRPIFVVGGSRSGTSILLQALGQHPAIYALKGEAPFLTSIGGAEYLFKAAPDSEYYRRSLKLPMTYFEDRLRVLGFEVASGPHFGLRNILQDVIRIRVQPWSVRHWCAKTFPTQEIASALVDLYPNAKFVYIVRSGLSVVHSRSKFSGFRDRDFKDHCQVWVSTIKKYQYFTTFPNGIVTRHEYLVADPENFFSEVFHFLELPPNVKPSEFCRSTLIHPLDTSSRTTESASSELLSRKPGWEGWTDPKKAIFKEICGPTMTDLNYEIPF